MAIGGVARTAVGPGERALIEVRDYGYLAVEAALGRPEDAVTWIANGAQHFRRIAPERPIDPGDQVGPILQRSGVHDRRLRGVG